MIFTHLITALANAISECATEKQIALLSVAFTQLADTLGTIAVINELKADNANCEK